MNYECVLRSRHRMGTKIIAVGEMTWSEEFGALTFLWTVPIDEVLIVEIDVFEDDDLIAHKDVMRDLYRGQIFPVTFTPNDGDDDDGDDDGSGDIEPDAPKPPGLVLDFDPDDLLRCHLVRR